MLAHAYWRRPEWDVVGAGRLPSPLRAAVAHKPRCRVSKAAAQHADALHTAGDLAAARPTLARPPGWTRTREGRETAAVGGVRPKGPKAKRPKGSVGPVAGWDFVSAHAIGQEYVDAHANIVSVV